MKDYIGNDIAKLFTTKFVWVLLKRLKKIFPQFSLSSLYRALVESHMWYVYVVWDSLSTSKIESLQHFEGRAVMIHTSMIKDDWTLSFLAVEQLIEFDRAVMVYKILNKLCPENLLNKFHLRSH